MLKYFLIVAMLHSLLFTTFTAGDYENNGFTISLVENGEVILTDEHIAAYIWKKHRILLTPVGIERWKSFYKYNESQNPPAPKIGTLTEKEFIIKIRKEELYKGHFTSILSSMMHLGVVIYDTTMPNDGEIWFDFNRIDGKPKDDPRGLPEIYNFFRKQGKLKEK